MRYLVFSKTRPESYYVKRGSYKMGKAGMSIGPQVKCKILRQAYNQC